MARQRRQPAEPDSEVPQPTRLRIIGGKWRNHSLQYSGDPRTRPMKDRVREALFNLVTTEATGAHAIDLFAGTGALGLEALSRGAAQATFIERHMPTARLIGENVRHLNAEPLVEILPTSAFVWAKKHEPLDPARPWLVLCSPPFSFWTERREEMLDMLNRLWAEAPERSVFVLEADQAYDFTGLPEDVEWDIRTYLPAVIAVGRKR